MSTNAAKLRQLGFLSELASNFWKFRHGAQDTNQKLSVKKGEMCGIEKRLKFKKNGIAFAPWYVQDYKVRLVVGHLGCVDFDLDVPPSPPPADLPNFPNRTWQTMNKRELEIKLNVHWNITAPLANNAKWHNDLTNKRRQGDETGEANEMVDGCLFIKCGRRTWANWPFST